MANVLPNPGANPDPLAHLHKMSATAGAASSQYVAINTLAIAALLLGLASILAVFVAPLLVVPAAGIVCGLVALKQINRSAGTQTGKLAAFLGMLLSVVMSGDAMVWQIVHTVHDNTRIRQINATLKQFSDAIARDDFVAAYNAFAPEFQKRIGFSKFQAQWKLVQQKELFGKIRSFKWNEVTPRFSDDIQGQVPTAALRAIIESQPDPSASSGTEIHRTDIRFRQRNGVWKIYDMPDFFPEERRF